MGMRHGSRLWVLSAALLPAWWGCGGGDSGTSPSAPPNYSGNWAGTTSDRNPISFFVDGQQVTTASIGVDVCMGTYPRDACCTFTLTSSAAAAISNNSFEIPVRSTSGISYATTVRGSFSSATSASGTVASFQATSLICGGSLYFGTPVSQGGETWTASKQ